MLHNGEEQSVRHYTTIVKHGPYKVEIDDQHVEAYPSFQDSSQAGCIFLYENVEGLTELR